jgi:hypothetical protein
VEKGGTVANDPARPSPEQFLAMRREQQRGRLKVYLGFAPRRGQDVRDAPGGPVAARSRGWTSSLGWARRTAGPTPRR